METFEIEKMAKRMRLLAVEMAHDAGQCGAHLGGGLSAIEIFAVLYGCVMNVDASNPFDKNRDILLLGKGHGVLAYYTALYEKGFLKYDDILSFEKEGSIFVGHPVKNIEKGIEFSSGSLGLALSVGVGMAISAQKNASERKIYVILGDGECQEGSIWEALFLAAKYKLNNLYIIVDCNKVQSDGFVDDISGINDLGIKMKAFGCEVKEVDGHSVVELVGALQDSSFDKPNVIIANTIKGKGVSFMENDYKWHHAVLNDDLYKEALEELKRNY